MNNQINSSDDHKRAPLRLHSFVSKAISLPWGVLALLSCQATHERPDHPAGLLTAGVVGALAMYFWGLPPFRGETPFDTLDQHRWLPLPPLPPEVPPDLARLIAAMAAKLPGARPGDAEVVRTLRGCLRKGRPPLRTLAEPG